jgi:hypothetical protein
MCTRKEIITAPAMRIRIPRNIRKGERTLENPDVNLLSIAKEMLKPILLVNKRRKSVEATHKVRLAVTIVV